MTHWTKRIKRPIPHPLHKNISQSRGIPRDEEKWGEALTILKIADRTLPPPLEHLPITWDSMRGREMGEKLPGELNFFKIQCKN